MSGSPGGGCRPVLDVVELGLQVPAAVAEVPGDRLLVVAQQRDRPATRAEDGGVEAALFADAHQDQGWVQGYGAEGGRRHGVGCVLPDRRDDRDPGQECSHHMAHGVTRSDRALVGLGWGGHVLAETQRRDRPPSPRDSGNGWPAANR